MRVTTKGRLAVTAMIESTRGPGGGYRLAKSMDSVSIADIIIAVDEPIDATRYAGKENCDNDQRCRAHELWASLNREMIDFLDSVSLRDLVDQHKSRALQPSAIVGPGGSPLAVLSDAQ